MNKQQIPVRSHADSDSIASPGVVDKALSSRLGEFCHHGPGTSDPIVSPIHEGGQKSRCEGRSPESTQVQGAKEGAKAGQWRKGRGGI